MWVNTPWYLHRCWFWSLIVPFLFSMEEVHDFHTDFRFWLFRPRDSFPLWLRPSYIGSAHKRQRRFWMRFVNGLFFADDGVLKCSKAHLVMSLSMRCFLRGWRPRTSKTGSSCSPNHLGILWRPWNPQILFNLVQVLHRLVNTPHLYFRQTPPPSMLFLFIYFFKCKNM